jgi:hypothetical protein
VLEGAPLSDLEKRMMYFTESGYVPEDPIKLNEEFEAEYDSDKYEAKFPGFSTKPIGVYGKRMIRPARPGILPSGACAEATIIYS